MNCTDTLIDSGGRCADPSWVMCDNDGYFCCRPGQTCFGYLGTVGCADAGYKLTANETSLPLVSQVARPTITALPTSSAAAGGGGGDSNSLTKSDIIAISIGIPVGVATILGTWFAWKLHNAKHKKLAGPAGSLPPPPPPPPLTTRRQRPSQRSQPPERRRDPRPRETTKTGRGVVSKYNVNPGRPDRPPPVPPKT